MCGYIRGTMNGRNGHCDCHTLTCIDSEFLPLERSFGVKPISNETSDELSRGQDGDACVFAQLEQMMVARNNRRGPCDQSTLDKLVVVWVIGNCSDISSDLDALRNALKVVQDSLDLGDICCTHSTTWDSETSNVTRPTFASCVLGSPQYHYTPLCEPGANAPEDDLTVFLVVKLQQSAPWTSRESDAAAPWDVNSPGHDVEFRGAPNLQPATAMVQWATNHASGRQDSNKVSSNS